jgi:site-specific recombinase XerD
MAASSVAQSIPTDIRVLVADFEREHRNSLARASLDTYGTSIRQLGAFLADRGMPTAVEHITREHIEAWVESILARWTPGTASNRYRGVQRFFKWAEAEGLVKVSPMIRMKPPRIPEGPPPILSDEHVRAILRVATQDRSFVGRRDAALLTVMVDCGVRRGEVVGMKVSDLHFSNPRVPDDVGTLTVTGKAAKTRRVGLGDEAEKVLSRYLRARRDHPAAASPTLFLGHRGALGPAGVRHVVEGRAREADLRDEQGQPLRVWPHLLRHGWANAMLAAGAEEGDVMALAGWRSREMLDRYGAANRAQRALRVAKRLSPADALARRRGAN